MADLSTIQIIQLIGYISSLILSGILVILLLYKHPKIQAKIFSLIIVCISIWIFFNLLADYSISSINALLWTKLAIVSPLFLGPLLLEFSELFPNKDQAFDLRKFVKKFIPSFMLLIFVPTQLNIVSIELTDSGIDYQPGILYVFFGIVFGIQMILVIRNFILSYKYSNGIPKYQIKFLGIGIVMTMLISITTSLILPLLQVYQLAFLGPVSTIVFFSFTTYSIKKYRLLDIQYLLNRVIYMLLSAILVFSIFYIVSYLYIKLFGGIFNVGSYILGAFISIAFVVYYPKLRNTLQFVIDEELFKAEYDREQISASLLKRIGEELDISVIQQLVLETITQSGITKGGFIRIYRDAKDSQNAITKEYEYTGVSKIEKIEHILLSYFAKRNDVLVKEELETMLDEDQSRLDSNKLKVEILKYMQKAGISILIPLKSKDSVVGILALREKYSESPFTVQDIDFFEQISIQISVAVQRALLYKESQDFAMTLQHKVDEATAELKNAYEELKKVDAEKDDFISIAGHELRTPAAIIKMSLWLVKSYKEIKTTKGMKKIDDALDANERLIKLIDDLLTTSRIDRSKFKIEPVKFDLIELISKSVEENVHVLGKKKLSVGMTKETQKMKLEIEADRDKVIEVVTNLISNAIKYTEKGSIMIRVQDLGKDAEISVKDTGVGISPEQMDKLFKKFSRLDHSFKQTAKIRGTGLGLYITKKILDQHHGTIHAESDGIGKGSTFIVTIPKVFEGELEMKPDEDRFGSESLEDLPGKA
ncbi:hypothetical protein KC660_03360 [Candidatus Dojkabacteria bacterium]|uniref:histidine kinase n=1 Tax=Candidatus Dojkabacteria bacterium TaxID=2099670 RepID=A0A955L3S3_9BACT|nr:hypothetical protein [Candidatus Dojkabacteria bacterium]